MVIPTCVVNPATGRAVLARGKTGRRLLGLKGVHLRATHGGPRGRGPAVGQKRGHVGGRGRNIKRRRTGAAEALAAALVGQKRGRNGGRGPNRKRMRGE